MENLEIILSLAGTAVGFLATAFTFVIKFITSVKAKKAAEQAIKIDNAVLPYIVKAESFLNYTGMEKKEYVMTKANQFAIEQGFNFDAELINSKVEELVRLTKEVNKREKDMSENSALNSSQTITIPAR